MEPARIIQGTLMGIAVAALVGAALIVGGAPNVAAEAEALVTSFYETGDPQLVLDHLLEGSIPTDEQTIANITPQIAQLLATPSEIRETRVVRPRGVALARIEMEDGFTWCVDADERVLIACVIGDVSVEATVDGAPVAVAFVRLTPFADELILDLTLAPAQQGAAPYAIRGEPVVTAAGGGSSAFELDATWNVSVDGTTEQTDERPLRILGDRAVQLRFVARDVADAATLASDMQVTWKGGSVQLTVADATWFIG